MSNAKLDQLISKRAILKSKITKFRSFISKSNQNNSTDFFNVKERLADLPRIYENYEAFQDEIETLDPSQTKDRDEFDDNYYLAKSEAQLMLESFNSVQSSSVKQTQENLNACPNFASNTKLPPLSLPLFDGTPEQWFSFYETFTSMIHNDSKLTNLQKLHYLKSCLKGDAGNIINTLAATGDNYEIALDLLIKRHDNKGLTIKDHVSALFNLKEIKKPSSQALRDIVDECNVHIKILKNLCLPTDTWDILLIYLICSKLDFESKREWENHNSEDIPKFNNFSDFLYKRAKTLQSLEFDNKLKNDNQPTHSKIRSQTYSSIAADKTVKCIHCDQSHYISVCESFKSLAINDRITRAQELKLCKNCLKNNHTTFNCKSFYRCKICKRRHHSLLHANVEQKESSENSNRQPVINTFCKNNAEVLLSTALVESIDTYKNTKIIRVLLDVGSQSNFISYSACEKLNLKLNTINYPISGINNCTTKVEHSTSVTIKSRFSEYNKTIKCLVLPKITNNLPITSFNMSQIEIPSNIELADDQFNVSSPIEILIGADIFWEILQADQIKFHKNQPYFQKTLLGWIVGGNLSPQQITSNVVIVNISTESINEKLERQLQNFWEIEQCSNTKNYLSLEELACENIFNNTFTRSSTGRYIVQLPFKPNVNNLGNSKQVALKRFFSLEKRLNDNVQLKKIYSSFMTEYLNLNHMELINPQVTDTHKSFYLPHHAVFKSSNNKLRVVYDGSAKSSSGLSLNDTLMVGPTIQEDLTSILMRFRTHKIVMTADICKMYRQVLVHDDHCNYQKIIWRNNTNETIREYKLKTITYGTASAPFLAIRSIHQLVKDEGSNYKLASNVILRDFYVDDLLTGANDLNTALKLRKQLIELLSKGGFELTQWASNGPDLQSQFNKSNNEINLDKQESKILGIIWNCTKDHFKYSIKTMVQPQIISKRSILSTISQLFDPLGLLTKLMQRVNASLCLKVNSVHYWTDSTIVLSWLASSPNSWKTFVANRVSDIQEHTEFNQWHHVNTKQNPADIISRGTTANILKNLKLWWEGPTFLQNDKLIFNNYVKNADVPERKRISKISMLQTSTKNELTQEFAKHSNYNKLIRIISYVIRFIFNCKNRFKKRISSLTYLERKEAETVIFKIIQTQEFSKDFHSLKTKNCVDRSSKLILLNPFIGTDNLLRVGGRLRRSSVIPYDQKFPIILPSKNHITRILIISEHERLLHAGPLATLYSIRLNYWPISGRNCVKGIVKNCIKCFKASPKSCVEIMGDLPKPRVEPSRPFFNCGLDYAGPILIKQSKGRGRKVQIKAYIVVFVCFATKSIHLELASDMTTDAFINVLKRFISRRGLIGHIYSDNATNFIGANNQLCELKNLFKSQTFIQQRTAELNKLNIEWHFIPPNSPNFGGLWEAAVKSTKYHLKRTVGDALLTYEEMYTVLVRIEACLNSRPLTPMSSDPNDLTVLTPGHFLIGGPLTSFAEPNITHLKLNTLSRWQYTERLRQMFWKRWSNEYLQHLQQRTK